MGAGSVLEAVLKLAKAEAPSRDRKQEWDEAAVGLGGELAEEREKRCEVALLLALLPVQRVV